MKRLVRTLIRLVAAGFVVAGGMVMGLEFFRRSMTDAQIGGWRCVGGIVMIVVGVFLFLVSDPLARQLTDDLDE